MHYSTNQADTTLADYPQHYQTMVPDSSAAFEFLTFLDPSTQTFHCRTFDDFKPRRGALSKNLSISLFDKELPQLAQLNSMGAGVFVVINDGGQNADAITRVRAVFADTDGAPLEPLLILKPHVVVESSSGNYHVYWFVDEAFPLERFTEIQSAIATKFGTDQAVKDRPRVMRLPGFYHQKAAPFQVRIINSNSDLPRYSIEQVISGLGLSVDTTPSVYPLDWAKATIPEGIKAIFPAGEALGSQASLEVLECNKDNREMVLSAARAAWPNGIPDRDSFVKLGMPLAALVVVNDWPEEVARAILDDVSSKPANANRTNNDIEWTSFLAGTSARHKNGEPFLGIGSLLKQAKDNGWVRPDSTPKKLEGMSRFALIAIGSKVGIIDLEQAKKASTLNPLNVYSRDDGGLLVRRCIAEKNPQADTTKEFKAWTLSQTTLVFNGVELNPNGTTEGYLNLFRGLSIVPAKGTYSLIRSFLKDIVCDGSIEYFDYLWGWMAHLVQKPDEKPGVSILLLGGQGVGKGTFAAKIIGGLYSHHFLHLQSDTPLTGNFNESLESSLVVFADEAFFSGDKRGANILKGIETEARVHVTAKFQPGRQLESHHRFIAASNNTHAAYVEEDDRRKFVLRLSESKKGDFAYWAALDAEIKNGGLAALAYDLQHYDLRGFEVRNKPASSELMRQKLASLDMVPKWWLDRLTDGRQYKGATAWAEWASSEGLHNDFMDWARSIGQASRLPPQREFVITLKKYCPILIPSQEGQAHTRKRGFKFPSLDECRASFGQVCGGEIDWDIAQ